MGLDMYLYRVKAANLPHRIEWTEDFYKSLEEIGYWRKANCIHKFFVGEDEDDCEYYVQSKEKLQTLLSLCKRILKKHSLAEELLPVQEGFFFGTLAYDEWYFRDLKKTVRIIEKALEGDYTIIYTASW